MLKTLIAVDGSEHAASAIEAVAALVRNGCQIEAMLLHVTEPPVAYGALPIDWEPLQQAQQAHRNRVLEAAEEQAAARGLALAPSRRAEGYAAEVIVREAKAWGAQQIAMGTRGLGTVRSLVVGSVAQRVVRDAMVPVLLAK